MARRNDIGTLGVRLQANTQEFVGQMARAERSVERIATTAKRATPALSAVGGALGRSSFGRGGAIGGAGIGVLEGLGFGALGAGIGGLAIGAFTIGVSEFVKVMQDANKRAAEAAAAQRLYNEELRRGQIAASDALKQLEVVLSPEGSVLRSIRSLEAQRDALIAPLLERRGQIRREFGATGEGTDTNPAFFVGQNRALLNELQAIEDAISRTNNEFASRAAAAQAAAPFIEFTDLQDFPKALEQFGPGVGELADAVLESNEQAAQREKDSNDALLAALEDWTRQNQRQTDQIVTSANRIYTQVLQLQSRRN